jgi:sulfite exporter TauE/SafE
VQRAAALVVGCVMVAVGIVGILRYAGVRWSPLRAGAVVRKWVIAGQRAALGMQALPRAALVGLLTVFLPCGWLYLFAIAAAGTGSPWWGAAVMGAFWLGTVPVLSLVGVSVQTLTGVVGQRLPLVTSLVIIVLGLYTAYGRLTIPAEAFERRTVDQNAATAEERVESALQQEPPCCCHESK